MVGVEHLTKAIHPSQLTAEFEGTLPYDNEEWIELRLVLISFYFYTSIHRVIYISRIFIIFCDKNPRWVLGSNIW